MNNARPSKPTIDAVNDAIGALSDLLHSLRAHAKEAAVDTKRAAVRGRRHAEKATNGAVVVVKRVARKAESTGERILDKAAKVWHQITGPEDTGRAPAAVGTSTRTRRAPRRAKR